MFKIINQRKWKIIQKTFIFLFSIISIQLLASADSFGQKQCYCANNSLITENTECEQWVLSDNSLLFYQLNCDSIWLTLKRDNFEKIIYATGTEYYAYHYRLDPQLIKEFPSFLLFRWGCPANGPCNYFLTDKKDGTKIKEFYELIYNDLKYETNLLIYISEEHGNMLELYNVELQKSFNIPFDFSEFHAIIPEYQFSGSKLNGQILELSYEIFPDEESDKSELRNLAIDLSKYTH